MTEEPKSKRRKLESKRAKRLYQCQIKIEKYFQGLQDAYRDFLEQIFIKDIAGIIIKYTTPQTTIPKQKTHRISKKDQELYKLNFKDTPELRQYLSQVPDLNPGDCIHDGDDYRNNGRYIYLGFGDGPIIIDLYRGFDDHGSAYPFMTCNLTGHKFFWRRFFGHGCYTPFNGRGYKIIKFHHIDTLPKPFKYNKLGRSMSNKAYICEIENASGDTWFIDGPKEDILEILSEGKDIIIDSDFGCYYIQDYNDEIESRIIRLI